MWSLLFFALAGSEPDAEAIGAALHVSPRPVECQSARRERVWYRSRGTPSERHCLALAAGYSALGSQPEIALAQSGVADRAKPGSGAALVLRARALTRLGKYEAALAAFRTAEARKDPALSAARLDHAHALMGAERWAEAEAVYLELLPRVAWLVPGTPLSVRLEAAAAVLFAQGKEAVPRARRMLAAVSREATSVSGLRVVLTFQGMLAALDASGEAPRPERPLDVDVLPRAARRTGLPSPLVEMLVCFALERAEPEMARTKWAEIAASERHPGRAYAQARLGRLGKSR